jgi:hypothetical protein
MRKIDEQIRDYYQQQGPSTEALARMKQVIAAGSPRRLAPRLYFGAAAAVLVAIVTLWWISATHPPLTSTLARQAAAGHNQKQELEFHVQRCAELQALMKSLDFTPVEPAMMTTMNMRIVGARYTTLNGAIAAQIVYVDDHGIPCTLYEVRPIDRLATVPSSEQQVDGVRVSVWREKGLLMVLARPMA